MAKPGKPEAVELARELIARYPTLQFAIEPSLATQLGLPGTKDVAEGADLCVVLGGDGTLIHAARLLAGRQIAILGVNLGSLGFMTEVPKEELFPRFEEALAGKLAIEKRLKLSCRLLRGGRVIVEDAVLNDVVINKGALARIADHETFVDGCYVTTYKSDGVIVATPTGSTAYALSAGGPIVHPSVDCMVLAPICPHALTQRPIVVAPHSTVTIALKSETPDVYLTLDGQAGHRLESGDRIEVKLSSQRVLIARNPAKDYFEILRQKLRWGER